MNSNWRILPLLFSVKEHLIMASRNISKWLNCALVNIVRICLLIINDEQIRKRYQDICHVDEGINAFVIPVRVSVISKISLIQFVSMMSVVAVQNQFGRACFNKFERKRESLWTCTRKSLRLCRCQHPVEQITKVNKTTSFIFITKFKDRMTYFSEILPSHTHTHQRWMFV